MATDIIVESVDEASSRDWTAFVHSTPNAELYHDYRWRALLSRIFGCESIYLIARDEARDVCGVLPLVRLRSRLFGDFLVSVPYVNYGGILASSSQARDALLGEAERYGRALGVQHVELRQRSSVTLALPARHDKVTMILDLPSTADELWGSLKGKVRSQIRRPTKAGAKSRVGGVELLSDFYRVFSRNMRDLGTPVYPQKFFDAVLRAFPEQTALHVIDLDGQPVAAGLVIGHRKSAEIPWASSLREANRESVNMLLYWSVLTSCIERGYNAFDFGRSSKDSGTYRFKAQWGAVPEQLAWYYWLASGEELPMLNPSNPKFRAAVAVWRRLPLPVANFLGPHIVKHLP